MGKKDGMAAMTTSLRGRVKNTGLPKSHALLPVLEAVVNGIQAIDARFDADSSQGRLEVKIVRSPQTGLDLSMTGPGRIPLEPIVGFVVTDNGVGFTAENMKSFETLDSDYKSADGCRGVGRLLWLKAFNKVAVRSTYKDDNGALCGRHFRFSVEHEVEPIELAEPLEETGTSVELERFGSAYQKSAPKTAAAIAREVFEHCIWYFLRPGGAPEIRVIDDGETVLLRELMDEFVYSEMPRQTVEVKGEKFDMVNLCLKSSTRNQTPKLYWCAASRVVTEENITGKVPGLYGRLKDENGADFTYICYLSSDYLDTNVRADRTAFDIDETIEGNTLESEITLDDVRKAVLTEIEVLLTDELAAARDEGKSRVSEYVSNRAPRYRPLLKRMESLGLTVDPSMKDAELETVLHRKLQKLEAETLAETQQIFAEDGAERPADYQERLDEYLAKITDINQSDLAAYVARRRVILEVLAKLIRSNDEGKYCREDEVHNLLIPMRKDSNEIGTDASNLWIIDERLAFHDYLASDKTFNSMPITDSKSTKEPDIIATRLAGSAVLAAERQTVPLSSIVVVEIKRPMRTDASEDNNPIDQCLGYVKQIREGGAKTSDGRPIPKSEEAPAFCYVIADLTPKMIDRCELAGLRPTQDGLAYFGFNDARRVYIEVMSFDRLVNGATERNRAFFDRLGLPASR
ncbi:ATP-binding protein [Rhodococcus sp. NPDC057529]|uniref:ATP-binding protein n=1 Tax=Rhodococcus sp. NPDC057529 TaxID=3346158 RepID=UPI0036718D34